MSTFVDTSALYALVEREDRHHERAVAALAGFRGEELVSHSHALLETTALLQSRIGLPAVRTLYRDFLPALRIEWVDARLHGLGVSLLLGADRRGVSLVDWVSFEFMRLQGISAAFTFDEDFAEQGFEMLPAR